MYRVSVLVLLGLVAVINAADDCATQHKNAFVCMTEIKESDEIKAIMERKKKVMADTCAPDFPKTCITEFENMMDCCKEMTAKGKDDPDFKSLEKKITDDVNKCFETEPQNPFKELEEFFMPIYLKKALKKKLKEVVKDAVKNMSESNEDDFDVDLPPPPPEMPFRQECLPTPAMMKCCKKEMIKAYTSDASFKKAILSLLEKKDKCDLMVTRECDLTTPELNKCFWGAHKDFFKTVFDKMSTCMKGKGSSGGSGSESNKGGEKDKGSKEAKEGSTTETPKDKGKSAPKSAKKGDK